MVDICHSQKCGNFFIWTFCNSWSHLCFYIIVLHYTSYLIHFYMHKYWRRNETFLFLSWLTDHWKWYLSGVLNQISRSSSIVNYGNEIFTKLILLIQLDTGLSLLPGITRNETLLFNMHDILHIKRFATKEVIFIKTNDGRSPLATIYIEMYILSYLYPVSPQIITNLRNFINCLMFFFLSISFLPSSEAEM